MSTDRGRPRCPDDNLIASIEAKDSTCMGVVDALRMGSWVSQGGARMRDDVALQMGKFASDASRCPAMLPGMSAVVLTRDLGCASFVAHQFRVVEIVEYLVVSRQRAV